MFYAIYCNYMHCFLVEITALKEECANLRRRVQDIELEMKCSRKENLQLQTDYSKLEQSYKELEELKERLENQESNWKGDLTDAQKEAEQTKSKVNADHMASDP